MHERYAKKQHSQRIMSTACTKKLCMTNREHITDDTTFTPNAYFVVSYVLDF